MHAVRTYEISEDDITELFNVAAVRDDTLESVLPSVISEAIDVESSAFSWSSK